MSADKVSYDFIILPAFNPNWSLEPPQLKLLGPVAGQTYNGKITFNLEAKTNTALRAVYVAVEHTPGKGLLSGSQLEFFTTNNSGWR